MYGFTTIPHLPGEMSAIAPSGRLQMLFESIVKQLLLLEPMDLFHVEQRFRRVTRGTVDAEIRHPAADTW